MDDGRWTLDGDSLNNVKHLTHPIESLLVTPVERHVVNLNFRLKLTLNMPNRASKPLMFGEYLTYTYASNFGVMILTPVNHQSSRFK